jgi:hypothetical protein
MRLPSIFTLSFKLPPGKVIRRAFRTGVWIVFFLLVLDISINILYPYPSNPHKRPEELSRIFNYGRSIEGKLAQMVKPTDGSSAPLSLAGWLDADLWKSRNLPTKRAQGEDLLVAIYGMSFSDQVGQAIRRTDSKIGLRSIAGPAGPPNYSFAAYSWDRGRHEADVVILGILASSVKALRSISGMTWQFESPSPYTYPRYFLKDDQLQAIEPKISSIAQLRAARQDHHQWEEFTAQMQEYDQYFSPFLFKQNFLDQSAIFRLIRRAWAQRHQNTIEQQAHGPDGFNPDYEIPILRAIASKFAATAVADGKFPIVLLLNDRGYDDHLFRALQPTLESASIPYISTHSIVPATNLQNFGRGGHFTKAANQKVAEAVLKLINEHFKRQ